MDISSDLCCVYPVKILNYSYIHVVSNSLLTVRTMRMMPYATESVIMFCLCWKRLIRLLEQVLWTLRHESAKLIKSLLLPLRVRRRELRMSQGSRVERREKIMGSCLISERYYMSRHLNISCSTYLLPMVSLQV